MSAEERKQILQMVVDGKISAEEAAKLMRALDEPAEEQVQIFQPESSSQEGSDPSWEEKPSASEFDEVKNRARRFAMIPLWIGIITTILVAWWMFSIQQNSGLNFWFFCLTMPLMFGILLIIIGADSPTSRWLYVNVDRSNQPDWPRHITLGFPLPLGFVAWFFRTFGKYIDEWQGKNMDEIVNLISMATKIKEPLIVNVDESDKDGERVQVFIG